MKQIVVDKKKTLQVRIDTQWHYYARIEAAKQGRSIKSLVEEGLGLVVGNEAVLRVEGEKGIPRKGII